MASILSRSQCDKGPRMSKRLFYYSIIGYPSETHLKLKAREISFVHNLRLGCQTVSKCSTEHIIITADSKQLTTGMGVLDKRVFDRFEYKMSFRWITYTETTC